jgi:hypothetical protein
MGVALNGVLWRAVVFMIPCKDIKFPRQMCHCQLLKKLSATQDYLLSSLYVRCAIVSFSRNSLLHRTIYFRHYTSHNIQISIPESCTTLHHTIPPARYRVVFVSADYYLRLWNVMSSFLPVGKGTNFNDALTLIFRSNELFAYHFR